MQRLLVVLNGNAGTADEESVAAALAALRAGADVRVAATGDEAELAAAVGARDGRRLVVLGGDGSVHAAVTVLARAGGPDPAEPIGIIPRGTGNDLAQALGLPADPVEAADVVLGGRPRSLDLLRADDGQIVVNAVHAGVGARASAEAVRFKDRLGVAAYPLGAAIAGVTAGGAGLRVEADGTVVSDGGTEVLMVGICNGPTIAGGTPLAPAALPDDGLADVMVCTATGPVARAAFAAALLAGTHGERDDVVALRARQVTVSGGPVDLVADGELQEDVLSRTWRVDSHAWAVLVPR